MKLSIIIPVRNEGNVISKTLDLITNSMNEIDYEVLVINDFSDDDTCKKVEEKITSYNEYPVQYTPEFEEKLKEVLK